MFFVTVSAAESGVGGIAGIIGGPTEPGVSLCRLLFKSLGGF